MPTPELDLWGKLAHQRDISEWHRQASVEDLQYARLELTRKAAENYWRLALLCQEIDVSEQSLAHARETLRIAQLSYLTGGRSRLDITNAQQSVLTQEDSLLKLRQTRQKVLNEQSILLDAPPGKIAISPQRLADTPLPVVRPDIPVSVLNRRPDIRSAELALRRALADVDIKRASYYPSFSLTGSLGASSQQLLGFLRNPLATIGTALTLAPFNLQKHDLDVRLARNDYEQKVVQFRQLLYKAMSSLDNALTERQFLMAQEIRLREILSLAQQAEIINEARYRNGAVAIKDWLNSQDAQRRAELALAQNRYAQLCNLMVLWLETGGDSFALGIGH